jgi:hypothetical protein
MAYPPSLGVQYQGMGILPNVTQVRNGISRVESGFVHATTSKASFHTLATLGAGHLQTTQEWPQLTASISQFFSENLDSYLDIAFFNVVMESIGVSSLEQAGKYLESDLLRLGGRSIWFAALSCPTIFLNVVGIDICHYFCVEFAQLISIGLVLVRHEPICSLSAKELRQIYGVLYQTCQARVDILRLFCWIPALQELHYTIRYALSIFVDKSLARSIGAYTRKQSDGQSTPLVQFPERDNFAICGYKRSANAVP